MKLLILILLFNAIEFKAFAETSSDLKKEFQTLGDSKEVNERVRKLENQQRVRIVQNRLVDRNNRIEIALDYGSLFGADTYVKTNQLGLKLQYHLNPQWSFGGEYQKFYNTLTAEGTRQYDAAYACQQQDSNCPQRFVGIDFPLESKLATVSFYPIYGKLNLFDAAIVQFDLYTLLGFGKKTLNSGESDVLAAGLGVGIWLNHYFTTRLEFRYENYKDLINLQPRNQNSFTALASLGLLVW